MTGRHLTIVVLLALSGGLAAEPVDVEPKIPPGYTPQKGGDEQGLWMEVDDYEKAVKLSALLVDDADLNNYVRKAACSVAGDYCGDLRIYVI